MNTARDQVIFLSAQILRCKLPIQIIHRNLSGKVLVKCNDASQFSLKSRKAKKECFYVRNLLVLSLSANFWDAVASHRIVDSY